MFKPRFLAQEPLATPQMLATQHDTMLPAGKTAVLDVPLCATPISMLAAVLWSASLVS